MLRGVINGLLKHAERTISGWRICILRDRNARRNCAFHGCCWPLLEFPSNGFIARANSRPQTWRIDSPVHATRSERSPTQIVLKQHPCVYLWNDWTECQERRPPEKYFTDYTLAGQSSWWAGMRCQIKRHKSGRELVRDSFRHARSVVNSFPDTLPDFLEPCSRIGAVNHAPQKA